MEQLISLPDIILLGEELTECLRLGHLAKSHQLTITFIDILNQYIIQHSIDNPHLNNILNVMLDAQQRDDRLYYADIIQYELMPYIAQLH
ncbi:hypothetical protein [Thalassotalea profundi]|uniref:Uncharacterized protein n=1 Tax=Thalassotalea profundi TaxID=2036687 RepID=A0ABQ3IJ32_9GAMM|nr:hypothetical protein [Thalassotalea profundi]GHE80979.1 hypothetical protein GCM10011501_06290 [Thalassotalea profundi]